MPASCRVCDSTHRAAMEAIWASGTSSQAKIARDFEIGRLSVQRHLANHLGRNGQAPGRSRTVRVAPPPAVTTPQTDPGAPEGPSESPVEVFRAAFHTEPHEWQFGYLEGTGPTVVRKGRQVGATQAAAALAIWTARSKAGADAVIISPSQRQSSEITSRARIGLWDLGDKLVQDSAGMIRLANGSRIISLPGNSRGVRGYAPALVVVDEAAWVADDTFTAVRPLVSASGGRLIVQSTPGSPVGFFYNLATATPDDWTRLVVRSADVPTIDPEFLAREQREMSPALYEQEYEGVFAAVNTANDLWTADDWEALMPPASNKE